MSEQTKKTELRPTLELHPVDFKKFEQLIKRVKKHQKKHPTAFFSKKDGEFLAFLEDETEKYVYVIKRTKDMSTLQYYR